MKFKSKESLKKHTSFKIGGKADCFCQPKSLEEIKEAINYAKEKKLKVVVIGAGTNLLVSDKGFPGLVIKIADSFAAFEQTGSQVKAETGILINKLIQKLENKGLSGLEFLAGIPGTLGGAIMMNAGAWGKSIGTYVKEVTLIDKDGKIKKLSNKELQFGYRKSYLQKKKIILLNVKLRLHKKLPRAIKAKISENLKKRRDRHPLAIPNCGSVFKNPKGRFSGQLIEAAECKGWRVGDAQVSHKHANFIVNLGDATSKDVLKLMLKVQNAVKAKFKIILEPEIKIMVD